MFDSAVGLAFFRFYADLNDLLPPHRRKQTIPCPTYDGNQSVKHLIEAQGIPHTEVAIILVDGRPVGFDHIVQEGERVAVYPPFLTLDVNGGHLLRPPLPRPARFLLDNHLGRLARYLRLLGFDTLYFNNELNDAQLAARAHDEKRVLLTRDRGLLKRSLVTYGYCLRSVDSKEQLIAVINRFKLADQANPWSRCLRCNGRLHPVAKDTILDQLEPKTIRYFEEFRQCAECGRAYWRGSHYAKLQSFIDSVLNQFPT